MHICKSWSGRTELCVHPADAVWIVNSAYACESWTDNVVTTALAEVIACVGNTVEIDIGISSHVVMFYVACIELAAHLKLVVYRLCYVRESQRIAIVEMFEINICAFVTVHIVIRQHIGLACNIVELFCSEIVDVVVAVAQFIHYLEAFTELVFPLT